MDDDDMTDMTPWYRSLIVGVGALLGVAVLVGGVIAVVAVGAVNLSGLGDSEATVQAEPSLYIPERSPAGDEKEDGEGLTLEDLNGGSKPTESQSAAPKAEKSAKQKQKKRKPKPPPSVISLSASPVEVSRMERIYLSGSYPREGASLQVQRLEGGSWRNFPTSASVSGGTFSTYVMTGQPGVNKFRVVDTSRGKKSNPVSVRVR